MEGKVEQKRDRKSADERKPEQRWSCGRPSDEWNVSNLCVCHRDRSASAAHNLICVCRRDGSASATYYFDDQMAAKTDNKSWLYLKMLKQEEEERVRKEQVRFRERRGAVALKACVC